MLYNLLFLGSNRVQLVTKQCKIKSSTRENDALKRHARHETCEDNMACWFTARVPWK